MEFRTRIVWF